MHRSVVLGVFLPVISMATAGCEDGPNQTYSPEPGNAWQNTAVDASVAPGTHDFDANYPTTGKLELCSADFKRERWAWMLSQPIQPPRFYAGVDLAGGDLWAGLTIDNAEKPPATPTTDGGGLCQSVSQGAEGQCPSGYGSCNANYWGNNQEVSVSWNVATHILDQMVLSLGYTGPLQTGKYPNHAGSIHDYTITIGDVIRRDGQPFLLPWTGDPATLDADITDIFNAMMASYATQAGIAWNTQPCMDDSVCANDNEVCQCVHNTDSMGNYLSTCVTGSAGARCGDADCGADGFCLVYPSGWIFGIRPLVLYVEGTAGVAQPALSTPTGFYNFWLKFEPYSNLPQRIDLGATGPVASGPPLGAKNPSTVCTQQVGLTFGDLTTNCVEVAGDIKDPKGVDAVNLSKITHGLAHDQEHWSANVFGVNQNFTSLKVANNPNIVVLDTDTPQPGDLAQDWSFDLFARGNILNDYNIPSATEDLRGSSLVYIEWARLMLADIATRLGLATPKALGDPTCTGFAGDGSPNYEHTTGCSGVEGLIIPGAGPSTGASATPPYLTDFSKDPLRPDLNPASNWDSIVGWYPSMLKPGSATGAVCVDPLTQTNCDFEELPAALASIWQVMLNHVITVLGQGKVSNLPVELQDVRYYYRWFGIAFVKYMKAYGGYNPATRDNYPDGTPGHGLGPSDVMAQAYDAESLFFDYNVSPGVGGAQTFDKFEYIDRDYVGQGSGGSYNWIPWDFEYGTDILGGNQVSDNWYRRMDREEIAMYASMLVNKSDTPGLENNVNATNLFGSSVIGSVWPTYACAIGQYSDPTVAGGNECSGMNPPLDPTNPSGLPACSTTGTCAAGSVCVTATSYEAGTVGPWCATACDYTKYPSSGCGPTQACVLAGSGTAAGCVDMKMDKNGPNPCTDPVTGAGVACKAPSVVVPHPILFYYPGAWTRTPFGSGHSPITLDPSDEQPQLGVAKITIPNFKHGPYTNSPLIAGAGGHCPKGYTASSDKVWCYADLNAGTGYLASSFTPLTPWLTVGGGQSANGNPVGFSIPLDGQREQFLTTGQLDFTGVLETYIVDYVPYQDPNQPSCVSTGKPGIPGSGCNPGFACDPKSANCVATDNTIRIEAIEGDDFLGQVFLCQDPSTLDILHVGMYDSALTIEAWLAAHPGYAEYGVATSAQVACNILISRSPYDTAIDRITSLSAGVDLDFGGGQGQGRVTSIVVFDTDLIQLF